jgi:hypothetical protein
MAMYRPYVVDSGLIALSATGLTALLYLAPTATNDANILAVKCSVEVSGSAPTAVANSDLYFSLNTVTGTKGGGSGVTPSKLSPSGLAANTVCSSGSTALTGLTQSTELWGGAVPFTAGAFTNEAWENTGREINLAASSQTAFYVNVPSGPGVGANWFARVMCWIAE